MKTLIFFCLTTLQLASQTVQWMRSEPFESYIQYETKVVNDDKGNSYTASYWNHVGLYIVKYDPTGKKLWEKQYQGYSYIQSMCVDKSGALYLSIGVVHLTIDGTTYDNSKGSFAMKFYPDGIVAWIKQDSNLGFLFSERTDANDEIYATGGYLKSMDYGNGNILPTPATMSENMFIGKFSKNLDMLWIKGVEGAKSNPWTSSGNFYYASNYLNFYPVTLGQGNNPTTISPNKYYIAKYDATGNLVWAKNGGNYKVAADKIGNVFYFDADQNKLIKRGTNGDVAWSSDEINVGWLHSADVACNDAGDFFFAGGFRDSITLGGKKIYTTPGNSQMFLAKYDSKGNLKGLLTSTDAQGGGTIKDIWVDGGKIWITGEVGGTIAFGGHSISENEGGIFTAMLLDDDNFVSVIENSDEVTTFKVFPNPSSKHFTITISNIMGDHVSLQVKDMSGRLIKSQTFRNQNSLSESLDLSDLPKGAYFISLQSGSKIETKKVIVQ